MTAFAETVTPHIGIARFDDIPGMHAVPVVADWRTLTREEFLANADRPMVFKGLAAATKAREWGRNFFCAFGDRVVQVRSSPSPNGGGRRTVPLRDFIAALDAGEEGVYAAEWYLFKDRPDLLRELVTGLPDYLADDWLESIPPPLAFDAATRNNVYWGAANSATPVHYDSMNACTWNITLQGVKRWLLFSTREFRLAAPQCWEHLRAGGVLTSDGFFTGDAIRQYRVAPPDGFPAVVFYTADVGAGDAIYIPWRWAHQVQNLTESIAVSRYYVSGESYEAAIAFFRTTVGILPALMLRTLIGTRFARTIFKHPAVRRSLAQGRSTALLRLLMRKAMGKKPAAGTRQPAT